GRRRCATALCRPDPCQSRPLACDRQLQRSRHDAPGRDAWRCRFAAEVVWRRDRARPTCSRWPACLAAARERQRRAAGAPGAAADDPALDVPVPEGDAGGAFDAVLGGSRFGNVLHAALERVDFAAWAPWRPGDEAPPGETPILVEALRGEGYGSDHLDVGT